MFIHHVSDTHGKMFSHHRPNSILIHSGDMLPNSEAILDGYIEEEISFQRNWVKSNIDLFPNNFAFVFGNHDFLDPEEFCEILNSKNKKAVSLHDRVVRFGPFNCYGFPYIPRIAGLWKYECDSAAMHNHSDNLISQISEIDMIVAHSPLDVLDYCTITKTNRGNTILANKINYCEHNVKYYLHGHIHGSFGVSKIDNMLVSNAATTNNFIEV
jgi:Icc-related predicted phosphoesterase